MGGFFIKEKEQGLLSSYSFNQCLSQPEFTLGGKVANVQELLLTEKISEEAEKDTG